MSILIGDFSLSSNAPKYNVKHSISEHAIFTMISSIKMPNALAIYSRIIFDVMPSRLWDPFCVISKMSVFSWRWIFDGEGGFPIRKLEQIPYKKCRKVP